MGPPQRIVWRDFLLLEALHRHLPPSAMPLGLDARNRHTMSDPPKTKSKLMIAAEKALVEAIKLPPGAERFEALNQSGERKACL